MGMALVPGGMALIGLIWGLVLVGFLCVFWADTTICNLTPLQGTLTTQDSFASLPQLVLWSGKEAAESIKTIYYCMLSHSLSTECPWIFKIYYLVRNKTGGGALFRGTQQMIWGQLKLRIFPHSWNECLVLATYSLKTSCFGCVKIKMLRKMCIIKLFLSYSSPQKGGESL